MIAGIIRMTAPNAMAAHAVSIVQKASLAGAMPVGLAEKR
jgi:hypothetical protein